MFCTGIKVYHGQFSHENTEQLVADYAENTQKLSQCRWRKILDACGANDSETPITSTPQMDERHRTLYTASSPVPMDTE
jgi:hypothetical protein